MKRIFKIANALALKIQEETGKEVIAIRVFNNCLCLYFAKGSCRFYSKQGLDWGSNNLCYFITNNFNKNKLSIRLVEQYTNLINWTEEYINSNYIQRLWLNIEYSIKYF